jgi:23S rRNA (cytidine1920-2'-O)/16S rRNA (cytidine1409-2'-O)-methyltransferase
VSRKRGKLRTLEQELARRHPELQDPAALVASGDVLVDGFPATTLAARVHTDASVTLRTDRPLRGEAKLRAALSTFEVETAGRVALDLGAAAGGFTKVLLESGAARVYAVDVGFGQLLGSLRQDDRVVVLERVNLAQLDRKLIPDRIDLVTLDLSYLGIARAAPQLARIPFAYDADCIALVKPMYELRLHGPPADETTLRRAVEAAAEGLERAGWHVLADVRSPEQGTRGAIEYLIHARRRRDRPASEPRINST